jgi:hypothetical protein
MNAVRKDGDPNNSNMNHSRTLIYQLMTYSVETAFNSTTLLNFIHKRDVSGAGSAPILKQKYIQYCVGANRNPRDTTEYYFS